MPKKKNAVISVAPPLSGVLQKIHEMEVKSIRSLRAFLIDFCTWHPEITTKPNNYNTWALKCKVIYWVQMQSKLRNAEKPSEVFLKNYRAVMTDRMERSDEELRYLLRIAQEDLDMVRKAKKVEETVVVEEVEMKKPMKKKKLPVAKAAAPTPAKATKATQAAEKLDISEISFRGNTGASWEAIKASVKKGIRDLDVLASMLVKQNPPLPACVPPRERIRYILQRIDA